ncbi:hypothetical protein BDV96DRAFT_150636 [Lophiotrema nucula]|uniref:Uncharacterized protein n=1 Tax=Lophiotrema nucula TaxID=690887 RepID=A0A6A5Z2I2_9PLEO|nr:hypothetical protein BDV96DRAFT_150636 [Lophiotrema nucula]
MHLQPRVLLSILFIFASLYGTQAVAPDLKPISNPSQHNPSSPAKRDSPDALALLPISDPSVLVHGRSLKREAQGFEAFDPTSSNSFFWGAYAGNTIYTANFTLHNEDPDEFILPIENFAKHLKSISCGTSTSPMKIEFNDNDSFEYAKDTWDWVNQEDDNKFTVVTKPNQCFEGDDRTPYLVYDISFDASKLLAKLSAKERPWGEIAHTFRLTLSHETLDPDTANVTHPHLMPRATKTMDLTHDFNQNLFHFESAETNGLEVSADAQIHTGGQIIADLDVDYKWFIPTDLKINIHPSGVHGDLLLSLTADGKLGTPIDWALKPEIEIPVAALNIKGILEIGPFVTMGVHFGSSAIEGHAKATVGARAVVDDTAVVEVKLRHPDDNEISGWTPHFEKIDPTFTASLTASMKAWAELGIMIKAEVLGRWGYQASVDAQLPYFEANLAAKVDSNGGICGTTKTMGVDFNTNVGIDVNLNAGEINKAPSFQKDLFQTSWPLYSTCIAFGPDGATPTTAPGSELTPATSAKATPMPTPSVGPTDPSSVAPSPVEIGTSFASTDIPSSLAGSVATTLPIATPGSSIEPGVGPSTQPFDSSSTFLSPSGTAAPVGTSVSSSAISGISNATSTNIPASMTATTSPSLSEASSSAPSLFNSSSASKAASKAAHSISGFPSTTTISSRRSTSTRTSIFYESAKSTNNAPRSSSTCIKSKTSAKPTTSSPAPYVPYLLNAPIYNVVVKSSSALSLSSTRCTKGAAKSTLTKIVKSTGVAAY